MVATYHDLYLNTRRSLASLGVEASQLEAKEILCAASGKTVEELVRDMQLYANSSVAEKVNSMTRRRAAGEPIAYVLGEWSFLGLPFTSPGMSSFRGWTRRCWPRSPSGGCAPFRRAAGCWTSAPGAAASESA